MKCQFCSLELQPWTGGGGGWFFHPYGDCPNSQQYERRKQLGGVTVIEKTPNPTGIVEDKPLEQAK